MACTGGPRQPGQSVQETSEATTSSLLLKFVRWNRRRVFPSVRFRLQTWAALATALVLTLALLFLPYAYTRYHRILAPDDSHGELQIGLDGPEHSTDPISLLGQANRLYWLNNGPKAAPLFARAEMLFAERGDARNELYAKVGRLRSEGKTMSFVELSRLIDEQAQNPIVRRDAKLRLWCLIAKGYTDIEIDYRAAKRDWLEVVA